MFPVVEFIFDPLLFKLKLGEAPLPVWLVTLVPKFKLIPVPMPVAGLFDTMLPKFAVFERRIANMTTTTATRRQVRDMINIL
jgi:hypothetical protein